MENKKYIPIIQEFIKVDRLHHICIEESLNELEFDIHRNQHAMLMFLSENGQAASQAEIAKHFDISPAAVTNTLKALNKSGYISKLSDSDDSRRNKISITKKGMNVISKSKSKFSDIDNAMIKNFSDEELLFLKAALEKIEFNLKEYHTDMEEEK